LNVILLSAVVTQPRQKLDYASNEQRAPSGLPPAFRSGIEVGLGVGGVLGFLLSFSMVALALGWWGEGYDDPRQTVAAGISLAALSLAGFVTSIRWARRK
jgi:hypothetical protein